MATDLPAPLSTRPLERRDADLFSDAFRAMGWSRPASLFLRYLEECASGRRWVRVAVWDGELAGYVTLVWASDDPSFRERGVPEVVDLNVLERYRGRGVGSRLMDDAEARARERGGVVGLRVGLHSGYGSAQRLYVKRGYVPDGSGALRGAEVVEEGAEIRLDDDVTLRMLKRL